MGETVIYADMLFIVNFLLDFALLWATAKFAGVRFKWRYLFLAALLGAIYGVGILVPSWSFFYHLWGKVGFAFLMVFVAFGIQPWGRYFKCVAYLYLISFAMAGAVLGGSSLLEQAGLLLPENMTISWLGLLFAFAASLVLARWGIHYLKRSWRKAGCLTGCQVWYDGKHIECELLLDTGNELVDPISGKPAMVLEYEALKSILPRDLNRKFVRYAGKDVSRLLAVNTGEPWQRRLRLVPYHSIGSNGGMLLGFVPDMVVLGKKDTICTKDIIICLYEYPLGEGKGYRGIVNPGIFEEAEGGEGRWAHGA